MVEACQSCGMPMAQAKEEDWGTNEDGSKSDEYCSYCFEKGAFLQPDITVEEMSKLSAKGWSDFDPNTSYEQALEVCKKNLPLLKRWR